MSYLVIVISAVNWVQEPSRSDSAQKALDQIVPLLASDDLEVRGKAIKELGNLRRQFGERIRAELTHRLQGVDGDLRAILQDQLTELDRLAEARRKLSLFDKLELPSVTGKKWGQFNTGWATLIGGGDDQRIEFTYVDGWILSETPEELTLLQTNLRTEKHTKKPSVPALWTKVKDRFPPELPKPGEFVESDFRKFCEGLSDRKGPEGFDRLHHYASGGLDPEVEPALFAWWALNRGLEQLSYEILERLEKSLKKDVSLERLIANGLAAHLWYECHLGANHGTPRAELLTKWSIAAQLPPNDMTAVARRMVAGYQKLVDEDTAWAEPADPTVLPPDAKVAYWAYKLRDQAAKPTGNPGPCILIGGWSSLPNLPTNPAEHLLELGWNAIPFLVEHLDDDRPTRSLQWWRDHSPGSYHLVDYGDCCQHILQVMTGIELPSEGYMLENRKKAEAKAKAVAWWVDAQKEGEEKYWVSLLEEPNNAGAWRASSGLVRINAEKYVPVLLSRAADRKQKLRHGILQKIGYSIRDQDRKDVEALLQESDYDVVLEAAKILWNRFSSEAAVRKIADCITVRESAKQGEYYHFDNGAMDFIAEIDRGFAREVLQSFLKKPSEGAGRTAVYRAWRSFNPEIASVLVSLLGRKENAGYGSDSNATRICDRAAESLIQMTGYSGEIDTWGPIDNRDKTIAEFTEWWERQKSTLDWAALRRKAIENR